MIGLVLTALISYLIGSIPFSYIAGRVFEGIDLREYGSGNLGASNAFRILGSKIAILVLIGDVAKGFLPVHFAYLANSLNQHFAMAEIQVHWLMLAAVLFAVLGHMFSLFLKFSGGKGIATTAGAFLALAPWPFLGAFLVWAALVASTRIVSLGSLAAAVTLPIFVYLSGRMKLAHQHWSLLVLSCLITIVVIIKHRSNIARLLAGTEPALARKKK